MSRWEYDIASPPAKAFEAVEAAQALLVSADLLSGALFLGSNDNIHAHEEPVDKPARWVTVLQFQEIGGRLVGDTDGLKVMLHITVDGERGMVDYPKWHDAMHDRIARSLVGEAPAITFSEVALDFRQITNPTRPEIQPETDTRMSFARYAVTLQPTPPTP